MAGSVPTNGPRKTRIAVLGGGCGAMAAAFELTATPELREQYEVTVYQAGWRLGGKGASGRNLALGGRIEEHGLHMWMGFYENAFRAMRCCYAEWAKQPDNPFQSWRDAFKPQRRITLQENVGGADPWLTWNIDCPRMPGKPGDRHVLTPVELLAALIRWLSDQLKGRPDLPYDNAIGLLESAHAQVKLLPLETPEHSPEAHRRLRASVHSAREEFRRAPPAQLGDNEHRRLQTLADLGLAVAKGFIEDVLPHGRAGFDHLNGQEFRAWLRSHGAHPDTTWSAPIRALYDLGFSFVEGASASADNAQVAAGIALRIMLLIMFGSKDAPLWKMQAGMGDTVFTPFYEVLCKREVHFEFFHRVESLDPSPSGKLVQRIRLIRQVRVAQPPYQPLVCVEHLPCWPSEPCWDQIEDGAAIAHRLAEAKLTLESSACTEQVEPLELKLGRDFDLVVLGISLGELRRISPGLSTCNDDWRMMLDNVPTVSTQAFQLWLTASLENLGWTAGPTVQTAYAEPFDTWGEMSHLIPRESWKLPNLPASIHYFCGALTEGASASEVKQSAMEWLRDYGGHLWPNAVLKDGSFNWELLVDPDSRGGEPRFDSQYWRANTEGSERYVLSTPGSIRFRLPPEASGFGNLFLAGDWTATTLSAGCVESAFEAGMRVSRAICGSPRFIARDQVL